MALRITLMSAAEKVTAMCDVYQNVMYQHRGGAARNEEKYENKRSNKIARK